MFPFLAQRLAQLVAGVILVSLLSFILSSWVPGRYDDPLRVEPGFSADAAGALRARHALDRPLGARFARWGASVLRGDLGISIAYDSPVAPLVLVRAARTLLLGVVATALAWVLAVPVGVLLAARSHGWPGRLCHAAVMLGLVLPEPFLALLAMAFAARTGLAPVGGMFSSRGPAPAFLSWAATLDVARHIALPALVLAVGLAPVLVRHIRSQVAATLAAGFILAARARGVPASRVLFRAALRVAAAPLASLVGLSIASLLSASLLVEVITGWPGLGPLLVDATRSRDIPVVAACAACSMALLALGMLAADIGVRAIDPRIRLSDAGRTR